MKKVNFKICFRAFLATFCLVFFGVVGANAQSKNTSQPVSSTVGAGGGTGSISSYPATGVFSLPQGTFQNNSEAVSSILQQQLELKAQLEVLTPGSSMYNAANLQYSFYQAIEASLVSGATAPAAIVYGLRAVKVSFPGTSNATLNLLKQEAIGLLD
jgi:hypothetical protein